MNPSAPDLRSLSSARSAASPDRTPTSTVPRPAARWRTRVLVPLAVILGTAGVLAYAARDTFRSRAEVWIAPAIPGANISPVSTEPPPPDPDPTGAVATSAEPGPVLVQAPGWVEPSPYAVNVPSLTEGVVREVLVLDGEVVKAGQVVARLVDDDGKLHVRAALAALAERRADVERAASAVASAEAHVRVEHAASEELRDEVTRKRGLAESGAVGAGEFRRIEIRLIGVEAKIAAAERVADEGRAALRQVEAAVESAQIAVAEAELRLARTEIRAPADGVVMARLVAPGSRISLTSTASDNGLSGAVLRLYDPSHLQVRVDVPLADAGRVGIGTPCTITSEALPDAVFRGRVARIVHEANIQRNTVQFKVSIDDPSPVLKPEMLTRVKLHAPAAGRASTPGAPRASRGGGAASEGDGADALLVPASALSTSSEGPGSVWIVDVTSGSPVARRRDVHTARASDEGYALVQSGLRLTDRVILDPPAHLRDGLAVRVLGERSATLSATP